MTILYGILIFWGGMFVGILFHAWIMYRFRTYSGTLVVRPDELDDKVVYSLILDEYPEKLAFEKTVIFKVDNSAESSDRK